MSREFLPLRMRAMRFLAETETISAMSENNAAATTHEAAMRL
mgnify:CR=1 FL=1